MYEFRDPEMRARSDCGEIEQTLPNCLGPVLYCLIDLHRTKQGYFSFNVKSDPHQFVM